MGQGWGSLMWSRAWAYSGHGWSCAKGGWLGLGLDAEILPTGPPLPPVDPPVHQSRTTFPLPTCPSLPSSLSLSFFLHALPVLWSATVSLCVPSPNALFRPRLLSAVFLWFPVCISLSPS